MKGMLLKEIYEEIDAMVFTGDLLENVYNTKILKEYSERWLREIKRHEDMSNDEKGGYMYTTTNFKTKKALKEAILNGDKISYYQSGPFGGNEMKDGTFCIEGPHYPEPHKWYATCIAKDGFIIKVK